MIYFRGIYHLNKPASFGGLLYIGGVFFLGMENPRDTLFSMPVQFVLVLGGVIALIAFVSAYGTNNPTIFGHSSDEIEFPMIPNERDCSNGLGQCRVSCADPSTQRIITGSCVTSNGWAMTVMGLDDADTPVAIDDVWDCTDLLSCNNNGSCDPNETNANCPSDCTTAPGVLIARVVCVTEN